jgi:dTDP-4-amino-4,6-dideoxygalactose transaminase
MALDSLKKRISKKTRAVIVQHTFGIPSPILEIKEYIKELNEERQQEQKIYLIEDCAHSLNIKLMDKYLGSFGDASFFSFGQDKVLSTTQGGCAIANSKKLEKKIEDIYKETSNIPEKLVKYNLRYPILWSIIKKTYFFPTFIANSKKFSRFTLGRFLILLFRFLGLTKQQASKNDFGTPQNDVYRLSTKQKYLLKKQLDKLERISKHRKENVQKYSKILNKEYSGSLIRYPLTVDNPSKVRSKLKEIKVIAGNWYNYPVIPKGIDLKSVKYHLGRNPNTEYLIEHIVNLPTGIHVSKSDIDSISQIVKSHILKE